MSYLNPLQLEAVYGVKYETGEKHQMHVECRFRDQDVFNTNEPQAPVIANKTLNKLRNKGDNAVEYLVLFILKRNISENYSANFLPFNLVSTTQLQATELGKLAVDYVIKYLFFL